MQVPRDFRPALHRLSRLQRFESHAGVNSQLICVKRSQIEDLELDSLALSEFRNAHFTLVLNGVPQKSVTPVRNALLQMLHQK